ncbi:MAG: restriction endonuclease, partial [Aestuariivita sp.]|nr:restriction endonuclease [Aestuariivita sp.]
SLKRFLEMEQGDRVIIPIWGAFHIYEIQDNSRLNPIQIEDELKGLKSWDGNGAVIQEGYINDGSVVDLGFFRRVRVIATAISRNDYAAAALTSRLKVRQTNVEITDFKESIENAYDHYKRKRPINLRSQLLEKCTSVMRETILDISSPDKLENLINLYFEQCGANTDKPKKNSDNEGDADIIATFESLKLIVYVQAKFHDHETNAWAVDQIQQYVDSEIANGNDDEYTRMLWVISTAEKFSNDCQKKAKHSGSRKGVRLIDGIEFSQMLLDKGIEYLEML